MTEKLFWQDAYQREFTANVVQQYRAADGHAVVLDRTCFYATSGGQPNDLGLLNQMPVRDVRNENGEIAHVLDAPLPDRQVQGTIDWERRFDHMQQHSGQHILSAAFHRLFKAETSSFHLGEEYCSIELNASGLKETQVREAEASANQVIASATPLNVFFIDPEHTKEYPLRKQSDLAEALRLVQIGEFDLSPCSGTHVKNAAEIGSVFIDGFEKLSQSVKINFLCGHRITRQYHQDLSTLKALSKAMTTSFELLPESVSRLQQQSKEMRKDLERLKEAQLKEEAVRLVKEAKNSNGNRLIVDALPRPYAELRFLAQRISEQPDTVGALASLSDRRAVFFKNPKSSIDLKAIFERFLATSNAKGGGATHFLEAGNITAGPELAETVRNLFETSS
jgi:alanyl-tRNA synthetase